MAKSVRSLSGIFGASSKPIPEPDAAALSASTWERCLNLINHVGYAIIIFSAIDYATILVPLRFTNPVWELEVVKQLVNQVVVLWVGFALAFYRPLAVTGILTKHLLRILSWLCLLIGVMYLLMLPLSMSNVGRVLLIQQNNLNGQLTQQLKLIDQRIKEVSRPGITSGELKAWAGAVGIPQNTVTADDLQSVVLTKLQNLKDQAQAQAKVSLNSLQKQNLKETIALILRGATAGVMLIWMWFLTGWARKKIRKPRRRRSNSNQMYEPALDDDLEEAEDNNSDD